MISWFKRMAPKPEPTLEEVIREAAFQRLNKAVKNVYTGYHLHKNSPSRKKTTTENNTPEQN